MEKLNFHKLFFPYYLRDYNWPVQCAKPFEFVILRLFLLIEVDLSDFWCWFILWFVSMTVQVKIKKILFYFRCIKMSASIPFNYIVIYWYITNIKWKYKNKIQLLEIWLMSIRMLTICSELADITFYFNVIYFGLP